MGSNKFAPGEFAARAASLTLQGTLLGCATPRATRGPVPVVAAVQKGLDMLDGADVFGWLYCTRGSVLVGAWKHVHVLDNHSWLLY